MANRVAQRKRYRRQDPLVITSLGHALATRKARNRVGMIIGTKETCLLGHFSGTVFVSYKS